MVGAAPDDVFDLAMWKRFLNACIKTAEDWEDIEDTSNPENLHVAVANAETALRQWVLCDDYIFGGFIHAFPV